jgi:3-keto-5-aminohexanoate cleavage enzyme
MSTLHDRWNYADAFSYMPRVGKMPPTIICCACNGGVQGKESNPALPETPEEIAESVRGAYEAGASMVHVHARQEKFPTRAAVTTERWVEVNTAIRAACPDIIINDTTGGGPNMTMDERLMCLDARPEVASLNLTPDMSRFKLKERLAPLPDPRGEVLYDECLPFSYRLIKQFATEMKKRGIKPELETYHTGGGWVIRFLIEEGLIEKPYWIQTVMGYQTSSLPTVDNVLNMVREFPADTVWLTSGIAQHQVPMTTLAILLGGHVRVGLEDNVYYSRGVLAESNAQLVERAARLVNELNREVASPAQAREMLGLSAEPSQYD